MINMNPILEPMKLWFLYILRLLLLPWSQTTQRRMQEEKSLKISPQKKKESANLRSIQIREWLLNVNKKETCYESAEKPAQNRADLFLSAVPACTPWAQRVPTSHVSPPLEQPVPRLVSAVPPPEPGWAKRDARRERPSNPWCSEPAALWPTRCLPGEEKAQRQVWRTNTRLLLVHS